MTLQTAPHVSVRAPVPPPPLSRSCYINLSSVLAHGQQYCKEEYLLKEIYGLLSISMVMAIAKANNVAVT